MLNFRNLYEKTDKNVAQTEYACKKNQKITGLHPKTHVKQ